MKTTKELVKFDIETAVITALDAEYKEVQKITDAKSKAIVAEGRRKYRELRLAVVDGHKDEKREALDYCQFLDAEKRRILGLLAPGERQLDDIWQAYKDEIDRKEKERVEAIQEKIDNIRQLGIMLPNVSALVIKERLIIVKAMKLPEDVEFTGQAEMAQKTAIANLEQALTERLQFEKDEETRKAEAERLEAQRKKQEEAQVKINQANQAAAKRQAENDARMAVEQAKIDEEKREIEENRKKFEETERKAKLKKEQEEFERQAKEEADKSAKARAQQAEIERERREEAQVKEKARKEALRPDKEKLIKFAERLLDIEAPHVKSGKAITIIIEAQGKLNEMAVNIKEQAKKL